MDPNQSQEELPGPTKYEDEAGYQRTPSPQALTYERTDREPGEPELEASEAAGSE